MKLTLIRIAYYLELTFHYVMIVILIPMVVFMALFETMDSFETYLTRKILKMEKEKEKENDKQR